jgi:solute carrier family 8 (sodium/calcium exchanger)
LNEQDDLTNEEKAKLIAAKVLKNKEKSLAYYRINGIRAFTSGKSNDVELNPRLTSILEKSELSKDEHLYRNEEHENQQKTLLSHQQLLNDMSDNGRKSVIEFAVSSYAVLENEKLCRVVIDRYGDLTKEISFHVETIDGTASQGEDYIKIDEIKVMQPGQRSLILDVIIIDDDQWEPDETFFIRLTPHGHADNLKIGPKSICMITIINDDG